ncbi:MAG: hypothetical protein KKE79_00135 [Actinobacteria bacterium]|nr:hypothetical protein [Actinomycetota bacterium]MBU4241421.1 hypothetical protein [Actinomycetota bacterium]MBU4489026.1 hypothetical protein [Actinomycetota bacterium]MCG2796751.1 hypothetical protein [Actinomycetes bacterium]
MENSIKVDASRSLDEIDPRIYGHFIENMARCIYGGLLRNERPGHASGPWSLREGLIEAVRKSKPPVIRWPGGLYADGYYWREGIGPVQDRPLRRNRYWSRCGPITRVLDPNSFGSDEYMALVEALGSEPYVNVNLGTGSAMEAARWVEYMNGTQDTVEGRRRAENGREKPWGVRTWGIGNEMYGLWALGHSRPDEYGQRFLEFRGAMEEVDGELDFVAVGADRYLSRGWNREVLSVAGEKIDLLSVHIYLPGLERMAGVCYSRVRRGSSGVYRAIVASPLEFERRLLETEEDINAVMGPDSGIGVALDEWNLWWSPTQLLVPRWTLRDALFVCGVFHAMHRMSRFVKMGNIAQLVNVLGVLSASGDRFYRSAIYYPFLMYCRLAGPERVAATCRCPDFSAPRLGGIPPIEDVPVLDCSATLASDGKVLTLFVINRHMTDDIETGLSIKGFGAGSGVEVHCLNGPGPGAFNWYGKDEEVSITSSMPDTGDVLPKYTFPAHSVTALVLKV